MVPGSWNRARTGDCLLTAPRMTASRATSASRLAARPTRNRFQSLSLRDLDSNPPKTFLVQNWW